LLHKEQEQSGIEPQNSIITGLHSEPQENNVTKSIRSIMQNYSKAAAAVETLRSVFGDKEQAKEVKHYLTCPRGSEKSLRLAWERFKGKDFLTLRVWQTDDSGVQVPGKNSVTIRFIELSGVIEALTRAAIDVERFIQQSTRDVDNG